MKPIDLEELVEFFSHHKRKPMPEVVRDIVLREGGEFRFGDLRTSVIQWKSLRDVFSPELAKKIKVPGEAYELIMIHRFNTPHNYVYDPNNGKYLGYFRIEKQF